MGSRMIGLDGVRGVAALAVMIYHFTQNGTLFRVGDDALFGSAYLAVDLFFMLSGVVLCHSYARPLRQGLSGGVYLLRRVVRLYPMFILGVIVGAPGLWLSVVGAAPADVGMGLALNAFGLPSFNNDVIRDFGAAEGQRGALFPVNPPAWSLAMEALASVYLLAALRFSDAGLRIALAGFAAIYVVSGVAMHHSAYGEAGFYAIGGWSASSWWFGVPRMLVSFTIGVLLHRTMSVADETRSAGPSLALVLVATCFALVAPQTFGGLYALALVFGVFPLLVAAAARADAGPRLSRLSETLGALSYPVYCLHVPIGRLVFSAGEGWGWGEAATIGVATAMTLAGSWLAARFYDTPARAWLGARLAARARATS